MGVVAGLITAGTAIYGAIQKKKAGEQAAEAIAGAQVDPQEVARQTREQGRENLLQSLALEQEVTPESQRLRRESTAGLLSLVGDQGEGQQISGIESQIAAGGAAEESGLLTESFARAREQLALGGELDPQTRNEITRRAIARGGQTGAARFTTPRDLGLRSLQLGTERLERAGRFGQIEQARSQQTFDNLGRLRELRSRLSSSRQSRAVQLAGFGQSLQPPDIGLAPGEFAGLSISNQNIAAQAGVAKAQARATSAQNIGEAINVGVGALTPIFTKTP